MTNPPPSGGVPDNQYRLSPDAALGGADAVQKTTYGSEAGTDPERTKSDPPPAPKGSTGTGPNATWAILVFLAVGAVLVYVMGWGR